MDLLVSPLSQPNRLVLLIVLCTGITAYLCGTVFVDRSDPKTAANKLNNVARSLKEREVKLWIFPEGTRNSDKNIEMLPFKKGAFHVAVNSNLPILPIVISRHNFLDERRHVFESGRGRMTVLPLIWPESLSPDKLAELTREKMLHSFRSTCL